MVFKRFWRRGFAVSLGLVGFQGTTVLADPKVVQDPMGPDGDSLGSSISPAGDHIAVLANKGSHLAVLYDGVAGPNIDNLQQGTASNVPYGTPTFYAGQVPIIFSDDGAHWAYMARSGDDFVVMLDGAELVRAPLRGNEADRIPLTFSAKGHHLLYSDVDATGAYQVVVDGKAGPPAHLLPSIAFSPDGQHYAYVGSYTNAGVGVWSFVDGRQVTYFGDHLQYTGRDNLISFVNVPGGVGLVLNGKPEIKAPRLDPMWVSPDGLEIAMVVTPNPPEPSFLTVNGKMIDGTQGMNVQKVYFSPDGKRWAALCSKKTGSKFMMVDGQKGSDYANIPLSNPPADNMLHWRFQTDDPNAGDFSAFQLPVPGFTADSSKFVYVAQAGGRQFMVVDSTESNGFQNNVGFVPLLSTVGHRVGVVGTGVNFKQHLIIDGAEVSLENSGQSGTSTQIRQFTFSPGAKHYAFVQEGRIYLDAVPQPGNLQTEYVFSPDDSHLAYEATVAGKPSLVVDGKVLSDKPGVVKRIFFSPDGQHIYWYANGNWPALKTKDDKLLYVDGKPLIHFCLPLNTNPLRVAFAADDTMTFMGLTDGSICRFRVTPDSNLPAALAAAPVAKPN